MMDKTHTLTPAAQRELALASPAPHARCKFALICFARFTAGGVNCNFQRRFFSVCRPSAFIWSSFCLSDIFYVRGR